MGLPPFSGDLCTPYQAPALPPNTRLQFFCFHCWRLGLQAHAGLWLSWVPECHHADAFGSSGQKETQVSYAQWPPKQNRLHFQLKPNEDWTSKATHTHTNNQTISWKLALMLKQNLVTSNRTITPKLRKVWKYEQLTAPAHICLVFISRPVLPMVAD